MLFGYNTNVPYKGKTYHVQTEDTGRDKCNIITLLYLEGAIIRSKKANYADLVGLPDFNESLRNMMKEQHKDMLKGLIAGKFDEAAPATEDKPLVRPEGETVTATTTLLELNAAGEPEKTAPKKEFPRRSSKSLDDILLEHISSKVKNR